MAAKPLPEQSVLLKLLRYDPESGKLFWRKRTLDMFAPTEHRDPIHRMNVWNANNADREAFTALNNGYKHGTIFGAKVRASRIIWKMRFGFDPDFIDHIDGDRSNNRLSNLRHVSKAENNMNRALRKDSPHGFSGITYNPKTGRWRARITKGGAIYHVGMFDSREDAIKARKEAEARLGFHPNHGRDG